MSHADRQAPYVARRLPPQPLRKPARAKRRARLGPLRSESCADALPHETTGGTGRRTHLWLGATTLAKRMRLGEVRIDITPTPTRPYRRAARQAPAGAGRRPSPAPRHRSVPLALILFENVADYSRRHPAFLCHVADGFSLGQQRLHLAALAFGKRHGERRKDDQHKSKSASCRNRGKHGQLLLASTYPSQRRGCARSVTVRRPIEFASSYCGK